MTRFLLHKRGRWLAGFIIAGCLVFGCVALARQVQAALLDYRLRTVSADMKDLKMKRVCYGRFLIDVPADAEV